MRMTVVPRPMMSVLLLICSVGVASGNCVDQRLLELCKLEGDRVTHSRFAQALDRCCLPRVASHRTLLDCKLIAHELGIDLVATRYDLSSAQELPSRAIIYTPPVSMGDPGHVVLLQRCSNGIRTFDPAVNSGWYFTDELPPDAFQATILLRPSENTTFRMFGLAALLSVVLSVWACRFRPFMRAGHLASIGLALCCIGCADQAPTTPRRIDFDEHVHDFGVKKGNDVDSIVHQFSMQNTSTSACEVVGVQGSCGCIASRSKLHGKVLKPGESAQFLVEILTGGKAGPIREELPITFRSGETQWSEKLSMTGFVERLPFPSKPEIDLVAYSDQPVSESISILHFRASDTMKLATPVLSLDAADENLTLSEPVYTQNLSSSGAVVDTWDITVSYDPEVAPITRKLAVNFNSDSVADIEIAVSGRRGFPIGLDEKYFLLDIGQPFHVERLPIRVHDRVAAREINLETSDPRISAALDVPQKRLILKFHDLPRGGLTNLSFLNVSSGPKPQSRLKG